MPGMENIVRHHPLAVLRSIIGKTQAEMAGLLEYSLPTIQSIETGRLKLSERLACKISDETGIELAWILGRNSAAWPKDVRGEPFTLETFERHQSAGPAGQVPTIPTAVEWTRVATANCSRLLAILLRAYKTGEHRLCDYKVQDTLDVLERQFGRDPALDSLTKSALETSKAQPEHILQEMLAVFARRLKETETPRTKHGAAGRRATKKQN